MTDMLGPPPPAALRYSVYDRTTGEIVGLLECAPGMATCSDTELHELAGVFDANTCYIDVNADPPAPIARPAMLVTLDRTTISADGTQTAAFTNVPASASLMLDGAPAQLVGDTVVSFSATVPGVYHFRFVAFPYLDQLLEVTAS